MPTFTKFLAILMVMGALALPFTASALGISFGGKVISSIPCMSAFGPSLYVITAPAPFTFVTPLIWTPATITKLIGPPASPGQQVLGVADVPFVCKIGVAVLSGMRMQLVGTSAPIPAGI
jgi:hypothetical protein